MNIYVYYSQNEYIRVFGLGYRVYSTIWIYMCVIHKMNIYVCLGHGIENVEQNEYVCVLFTKWRYMCVWVRVMNIYVCLG